MRSGHLYTIHELPSFHTAKTSLQLTRYLHFRADFDLHQLHRCPHFSEDRYQDLYHEPDFFDDSSWSSDGSTTSIESPIIRHTESFDILANAAETILVSLHDNQLDTFSWEMGTCIPASVLGPSGIINKCQSTLRNLNLITDWQCYRTDPFWLTSGCEKRSELSLQGLKDLRRLCWKAPHEEDLFALSCVVDTNKRHLEALELDFIEWDTSAGRSFRYGNETPDVCPLLGDVLHLSPIAGGAIFPKLQELSLSEAAIGPKLALAIDFNVLRVLKLRGCYGWCEFLEHLTASRVKLEITTFELIAAGDKSPAVEIRDDTINEFLASFTGLQELYLLVSAPWFPCGQFSSAIANHRATLRQCVLDGLWENIPEEPERRMLAAPFGEGFLGILDLQAIGLINDHHTLKNMLLPFASKSCLNFIHIRQGYVLPWHQQVWVWQKTGAKAQKPRKFNSQSNQEIRHVIFNHYCCERESFSLKEEFCSFVEWAFGDKGIRSLQIMAVGDHSPSFDQLDSQIFFQRKASGGFNILCRGSREWKDLAEENTRFLQSCPKLRLL
ncbi:hypothetical protein FOXYSP1_20203 [Fusarium oxysporum f. sp. phaseoli]